MGPTILGCLGLRKPSEQGHRGNNVMACPGEVWEGFIVLDDPLVHITGHSARTPTVSMVLDLSLKLHVFLWQNLLNYRAHMHLSLSNEL